jgi:hypothetical protein
MNKEMYLEIIANFLVPYCAEHFNVTDAILHQDNDPKHTSVICREALNNIGINWIKSPAKSPDLNPIELLWHPMLVFIRKKFCKSPEDVVDAIIEWMDTVTPEMCRNIIDTLKKNIPIVIEKKGGWSNH